jgi:hypothetical protein
MPIRFSGHLLLWWVRAVEMPIELDTDLALSKVSKRLLSHTILLREFLRLSCVFLITVVETKNRIIWQAVRHKTCFFDYY